MAMTDTLALKSEDTTQLRRCCYCCLARKTGLQAQPLESYSCLAMVEPHATLAMATDIVMVTMRLVMVNTDLEMVVAHNYQSEGPLLADIMAADSQGKVMDLTAASKDQKDQLATNLSTFAHNQEATKATKAAPGSFMVGVGPCRIAVRVATGMDFRSESDVSMANVHKLEYDLGSC